jgi:DNA-binding MarR family transcriptional regulator
MIPRFHQPSQRFGTHRKHLQRFVTPLRGGVTIARIDMNPTSKPRASKHPFGNRGMECLCGNVRMAARALTTVYDEFLAPSGLTANQLAVLWCVVAREPVPMREVAQVLVMDKTTVSRNLAGLLDLGLVVCRAGPDARVKLVSCTAKGRKAFASALPRWKKAQQWVEGRLGRESFVRSVAQTKRLARLVASEATAPL